MRTGRIKNGYGIIQRDIMTCDISIYSKAVYCLLVSYAGEKDYCFPSLKTMCSDLKISKPTIINALKELISVSLIEADKRKTAQGENVTNIYYPYYLMSGEVVKEVNHLVSEIDKGSKGDLPPVVKEVDTKINNFKINNEDKKISNNTDLFSGTDFGRRETKKTKEKSSAKKEKKLLRDCTEITSDFLKDKFKRTLYQAANIEYYYECALAWSDGYNKSTFDWVATIRNFILKDYKAGKMVTGAISQEQKLSGMEDLLKNFEDI